MAAGPFNATMILAILPQIGLLALGVLVSILDLLWKENQKRNLGWLTASGLALIMVLAGVFTAPAAQPVLVFGGMLRHDWLSFVFQMIFLFGAALTALFAMDSEPLSRKGEAYMLLVAATLGMTLMASAADLIMLFLAIEMTSIPLYILAGFIVGDNKSTESGFKYLLFGATTSAVMLYGFSLLYGFAGTTQIYQLAGILQQGQFSTFTLIAVLMLVLVGFSFKVSAVPFHFWAPDVYEGSPTPIAGFLSTASKAAGFAVLMRFLLVVFPMTEHYWIPLLAVISTATMIVGNTLALAQKNVKRLLAYSSIAQAGYMLIGVASVSPLGITASVFYLTAYLVTNLAAFGVVTIVGRSTGSDELSAYAGLSRRAPGLAMVFLVALLSLGGIPPFGGFVGKILVFAAAINSNLIWLAVLGILNSIIALYYYLMVLKVVYLYRSEDENRPLAIPRSWAIAMGLCVVGILLLGTVFGPWYQWSVTAASSLF
ncbi:MAG: NADH-quinone oxidoreductase subunit N [Chloroflexi bacterium]|nr:NADH-quinone oxidoreductase subunit N [Chloroflexota bacterium]